MIDQMKNILIGLFVLTAAAIIVFMLLFLHPSMGDEGQVLRVRFANIDKITLGTRVTFGGKPVGEVMSINEIPGAMDERIGREGRVYVYELDLAVDSGVVVYNSDNISLRTSGLLGERSVAIIPLPPKKGETLEVINDRIIYASETGSIEEAVEEIKEVAQKFGKSMEFINEAFEQMQDDDLWSKVAALAGNLSEITEAINKPEELSEIIDNVVTVTGNMKESWKKVDSTLDTIGGAADSFSEITDTGKEVIVNIREGKGTIGKLLSNEDLYLKISALFAKGDTLMNDINHYGLLFHLDKGWQRMRARRMNLVRTLSTPQQFRNYFNDEMDQISTSLSRVAMLLDRTVCCYPYCCDLSQDCEFVKVYAELLRRVKTLEEALQMYNIQVMDCDFQQTELVEYREE